MNLLPHGDHWANVPWRSRLSHRPALVRNKRDCAGGGFSLLEMMAATAIMAAIMGTVVVVVRSGYGVWNAQEQDIVALENAYGVLRHFVRQMRQADAVTAITAAGDPAGSLSFLTASGATHTLRRDGSTSDITYDNGVTSGLLARSIDQMTFVGYEADGVTPTTAVADIQMVECTVRVTLTRGGGTTSSASARAWIRSW